VQAFAGIRFGTRTALIASSVVLFAAIFAVRLAVGGDTRGGIVFLFAIPIAALAAEFGRLAGIGAALVAMLLTGAWVELRSVELGELGFLTRALTFLGIGILVGQFSASSNRERRRLIARLGHLAHTDELTGLPNRRAWEQALERELARAAREQASFAVAIVDLDRFKAFNDAHGHPRGDELLAECAAAWRPLLRATDLLARIGGEEFGVLLVQPGTDVALAAVLERVRVATPGAQTCSIGAARWQRGEPGGGLMRRADLALYRAKETGRNRVVVADPAAGPGNEAALSASDRGEGA
jgi:diguanylate cyclase